MNLPLSSLGPKVLPLTALVVTAVLIYAGLWLLAIPPGIMGCLGTIAQATDYLLQIKRNLRKLRELPPS